MTEFRERGLFAAVLQVYISVYSVTNATDEIEVSMIFLVVTFFGG